MLFHAPKIRIKVLCGIGAWKEYRKGSSQNGISNQNVTHKSTYWSDWASLEFSLASSPISGVVNDPQTQQNIAAA